MANPSSGTDIFTVLVFIALVALIGGIVYAFIRLSQLGISPFQSPTAAAIFDTAQGLGLA